MCGMSRFVINTDVKKIKLLPEKSESRPTSVSYRPEFLDGYP